MPIIVGNRVFAFFHHSFPTSVTCVDRTTGARCPGYPKPLACAGERDHRSRCRGGVAHLVHLFPENTFAQSAPIPLLCWDAATNASCGLTIVDRMARTENPGASAPVTRRRKIWFGADTGKLYCVDPATRAPCAPVPFITTGLGEIPPTTTSSRTARAVPRTNSG